MFIGLGHDDGEGVGDGAFCGGVGGGHDDFPLAGREVVFFVAGLGDAEHGVFENPRALRTRRAAVDFVAARFAAVHRLFPVEFERVAGDADKLKVAALARNGQNGGRRREAPTQLLELRVGDAGDFARPIQHALHLRREREQLRGFGVRRLLRLGALLVGESRGRVEARDGRRQLRGRHRRVGENRVGRQPLFDGVGERGNVGFGVGKLWHDRLRRDDSRLNRRKPRLNRHGSRMNRGGCGVNRSKSNPNQGVLDLNRRDLDLNRGVLNPNHDL